MQRDDRGLGEQRRQPRRHRLRQAGVDHALAEGDALRRGQVEPLEPGEAQQTRVFGADVGEHLELLSARGVPGVVVVPVGFVSDHLEVVYDLDTLAKQTADEVGLPMVRAATPGTDPRFVEMVVDLVRERVEGRSTADRAAWSGLGIWPDVCVAGCCPNPRRQRPALAGADP